MTKIVIVVEGGVVQNVIADSNEDVRVITLDYDTEGADPDYVTIYNSHEAYIVEQAVEISPEEVEKIETIMNNMEEN